MSATLRSPDVSYVYDERGATGALTELAVVELRVAAKTFDGETVSPGQVGTIVMVHGDGEAYDVEFTSPAGVASLSPDDITPV